MTPETLKRLIAGTRRAGVLLDTKPLVLWVVGSARPTSIQHTKSIREYRVEDFQLLDAIVSQFDRLFTTTGILVEASHHLERHHMDLLRFYCCLERNPARAEELRPTTHETLEMLGPYTFDRLGVADGGVVAAATESCAMTITADLDLYIELGNLSLPVLNFSHLLDPQYPSP